MKRFAQQFKTKADSIRLEASERHELRERLISYMEYHPLPGSAVKDLATVTPFAEPAFRTLRIDALLLSRFAGAFAVLALIVVPVIAENTIPGDVLYPIKVRVNEEVRGSLMFSPFEKVEWETTRLERRIAEAQLLSEAGLLTDEVEAEVAQAVKYHSDVAKKEIETLNASGAEEAAFAQIALSSALEVQSEVLEKTMTKQAMAASSSESQSVSPIASVVDEVRAETNVLRQENRPAPDRLLAHIEAETTRAYEYLDSIESVASDNERSDIRRRLSDINKKIAAAQQEDQEVDTDKLFGTLSDLRKLISFMTNIDVRENVSIEDLVPIVLTDEERIQLIEGKLAELEALQLTVDARLSAIPENLLEKITNSIDAAAKFEATATASLAAQELDAAQGAVNQALDIMLDLEHQTVIYESGAVGEVPTDAATASTTDSASTTPSGLE